MPLSQRLLTGAVEKTYGPLPFISDANPSHMKNWFECIRSRNQTNATVEHGFAHSVAVIMAAVPSAKARSSTGIARTNRLSITRWTHDDTRLLFLVRLRIPARHRA